jgi:hypothetical protein
MGLEQCIAGLDADEGKICPVNPCGRDFFSTAEVTRVHGGKTLIRILFFGICVYCSRRSGRGATDAACA